MVEEQTEAWNKKTLLDITATGNVIVQNPGTGYQLLDKFEVQGGDGSSAEAFIAMTGVDGSVKSLFWNEADTTLVSDFGEYVKSIMEKIILRRFSGRNFIWHNHRY